jgi:hypothetical protein
MPPYYIKLFKISLILRWYCFLGHWYQTETRISDKDALGAPTEGHTACKPPIVEHTACETPTEEHSASINITQSLSMIDVLVPLKNLYQAPSLGHT